jgi:hypothetical protein
VEHGSLEYFRWFYEGRLDRPGDMEDVLAPIVTLRDGRATRLDTYLSAAAARQAAGLA